MNVTDPRHLSDLLSQWVTMNSLPFEVCAVAMAVTLGHAEADPTISDGWRLLLPVSFLDIGHRPIFWAFASRHRTSGIEALVL